MYRNFFREYTHLQWRGYVQIHMQPVEEKIWKVIKMHVEGKQPMSRL